jgi:hypothetical protein
MFNGPTNIIQWKGRTYNEIVPSIRRNTNTNASTQNTFLPNPCKIYRREIPFNVGETYGGTGRNPVTIIELEQPGYRNYHIGDTTTTTTICDANVQTELPLTQKECVANVLRKVRSAGMNPERPVFVSNTAITTKYYTSGCQYLKAKDAKCDIDVPNNGQFNCQGATTYSNYILRKQYDTNLANWAITAATFKTPILYAESIKSAIGDTTSLCAKNVPNVKG